MSTTTTKAPNSTTSSTSTTSVVGTGAATGHHTLMTTTQQWMRLGDLQPHPLAQRVRFDKAHVQKMVENFDPNALGVITVARTRRHQLWIVDGQHRHAAAIQYLGGDVEQLILCNVVDVENDAEAGELFLLLNNHKAVRTFDKFLVRIVAQDTTAVAIVAILAHHGLRVSTQTGAGIVKSVDALEWIFDRNGGAALLDRVLSILHGAWGDDTDAYNGQLMRGVALLLMRYGNVVEQDDLVRKLAKSGTAARMIGQGRELATLTRTSAAYAVAERIRLEYNRSRRVSRLEDSMVSGGRITQPVTAATAPETTPTKSTVKGSRGTMVTGGTGSTPPESPNGAGTRHRAPRAAMHLYPKGYLAQMTLWMLRTGDEWTLPEMTAEVERRSGIEGPHTVRYMALYHTARKLVADGLVTRKGEGFRLSAKGKKASSNIATQPTVAQFGMAG